MPTRSFKPLYFTEILNAIGTAPTPQKKICSDTEEIQLRYLVAGILENRESSRKNIYRTCRLDIDILPLNLKGSRNKSSSFDGRAIKA